jgi:hypothetical protein
LDSSNFDSDLDNYIIIITIDDIDQQVKNGDPTPNTTLDIVDLLPDMSQKEFFLEILKVQCLIPIVNGKTVTLERLQDITAESPQALAIDTSREINYIQNGVGLSKKNMFKWAENDYGVVSPADGVIESESIQENSVQTLLESKFTIVPYVRPFVVGTIQDRFPGFEVEHFNDQNVTLNFTAGSTTVTSTPSGNAASVVKEGDFLVEPPYYYRVMNISGSNLIIANPSPVTTTFRLTYYRYKRLKNPICLAKIGNSASSVWLRDNGLSLGGVLNDVFDVTPKTALEWDNNLIDTYYGAVKQMLERPIIVQCFTFLTAYEYSSLDLLKPVHVPSLGQNFYINKIEQWKPNKPTRLELLKLQL